MWIDVCKNVRLFEKQFLSPDPKPKIDCANYTKTYKYDRTNSYELATLQNSYEFSLNCVVSFEMRVITLRIK